MKMFRMTVLILTLVFVASAAFAFGGSAPKPETTTAPSETSAPITPVVRAGFPFLVDNFEDGDYTKAPEWFTFDNLKVAVEKNASLKATDLPVGEYSLNLSGTTNSWYVGGMGTMLGVNASNYAAFDIDVYGYGADSGKLKIELYNNDSGKDSIEVDKSYQPMYDDLWAHEINVDWDGWKHLSIPFSEFKLVNPGKGNGIMDNPVAKVQLICVANSEQGTIKYNIDNLELGAKK